MRKAAPLRAIIAYKLIRAVAALVAAAVLAGLALTGRAPELHEMAAHLRHHATHAWAILAANALFGLTTTSHVWLVSAALVLDGSVTFLEGWGLHRGWRWAPWLVVALTFALVPFEVVALARHVAVGRVALLVVNLAVAIYLARRALAHAAAHAS